MSDFFVVAAGERFEPARLLDRLNNPLPLKDLTLCNINPDERTLTPLCNYLEKTSSLSTFDFTGTRLSQHDMSKLLTALANNKSLKAIHLDFCQLLDTHSALLIELISAHSTLTILSLDGHCISLPKIREIENALAKNRRLQQVTGLPISECVRAQFEHNKKLAQAKQFLEKSQQSKITTSSQLIVIETAMGKFLEAVNKNPDYTEDVKGLLSDMHWFLATEYTRLGQVKSALRSYKLFKEHNQENLAVVTKAELEIANTLYIQYLATKVNKISGPAQSSSPTEEEDTFSAQRVLLKAYKHLLRAEEFAISETKSDVARLKSKFEVTLGESSIQMGESILEKADKADTSRHFKRQYTRSTHS